MTAIAINPRVMIVREAITRLVPVLAGRNIRVTQAGSQAFCQWNPDGSCRRINLPYLPDDASDELITAVQGFLDHEVGHALFTDPKATFEAAKLKCHKLHNILEDPFIERKMADRYTGAAYNMRATAQMYLCEKVEKALQEHPEVSPVQILFVPMIRALSGQDQFVTFMKDKWHLVEEFTATVGKDLIKRMPKADSSWDTLEIAKEIQKRMKDFDDEEDKREKGEKGEGDPSEGSDEEGDDSESSKDSKDKPSKDGKGRKGSKGKKDKSDGSGDDKSESDDEVADGESSEQQPPADEGSDDDDSGGSEDGEKSSSKDDGEESGSKADDSDDGDDAGDGRTDDDDASDVGEADADGSDDGESDGSPDGQSDGSDEADDAGGSEEGGGDDADGDHVISGGGGDELSKKIGQREWETLEREIKDYDEAAAEAISVMAAKSDCDYLVYTRDHDVVETIECPTCPEHLIKDMEDKVDHMVGPMQKDLERAIAARSAAVWTGGHKSGRLHGPALVRIVHDRTDLFRRKQENLSKSVAVSLVNDFSGSMTNDQKLWLAMMASYALSSTLERLGITHEVIGFTTRNMPGDAYKEMERDPNYENFARIEALYMPIIKEFNERINGNVKKRFAAVANYRAGFSCQNNVDGECVQVAAYRLSQRTEKRKVMIVLSDGQPACDSPASYRNYELLGDHLRSVVTGIQKAKIDVVGIGINSYAVQHFYPKSVVLTRIDQLPLEVMRQLKALLVQ